jgi:hypothetical protein
MAEVTNLVSFFTEHKTCKINWSANGVAHEIAGFARRERRGVVLQSAVPPYVVELAWRDRNDVCNKYIFSWVI